MRVKKIILSLFDGGAAGAAESGAQGGAAGGQSGSTTGSQGSGNVEIRSEIARRGKALGIEDKELLRSYQEAYDSKHKAAAKEDTQQTDSQVEESGEVNAADDFEKLIKGQYKEQFNKRVHGIMDERLSGLRSENSRLKEQAEQGDKLISLLREKYPEIKDGGPDELIKALQDDSDTWRQRAIADGVTADEAKASYEQEQVQRQKDMRLEELEKREKARELDARMQALARQTQQQYPDFDLRKEFENPKFKMALDFVAAQNAENNRQKGKNDEIFDLTFAYEMAHADEIKQNTIKRVSKATMSAMAQDIAANGRRVSENVSKRGAAPDAPDVWKMSDEEFEKLKDGIRNGTARIPRG